MSEPSIDAPAAPGPAAQTIAEITSQPDVWARALTDPAVAVDVLPAAGERAVAIGCGTSYYIGEAWARLRTAAGLGRTRAAIPSELPWIDEDETVVLLSRSGTTADVAALGRQLSGAHTIVGIVGTSDSPIEEVCDLRILLDFADEQSVVQTRFATTALAVLRRSIGDATGHLVDEARTALDLALPLGPAHDHVVFLGHDWSAALAHEAALKLLEAAGAWTEAYPVREYQHGPIAAADSRTLVWALAPIDDDLREAVNRTGATLREATLDPMVELVLAHRVAVELARRAGRDPDRPRHLSRSVTAA